MADRNVLLASASPRRRGLLASLGVPFEVVAAPIAEDEAPRAGEAAPEFALRLALAKARAVAARNPGALVLGADTVVVLSGRVLGKPRSVQEAGEMLRRLRGRVHRVITAVALVGGRLDSPLAAYAETLVRFRHYSDEEVEAYVASGDPMDKAGGYAIQSEAFRPAEGVMGCLLNVIGLPCCLVAELLRQAGVPVEPAAGFSAPEPCRRRPGGCPLAR